MRPNLHARLQNELAAKPTTESVPADIWSTIYPTWTGLWTDAYGKWDERQPSDIYPITEFLSESAEQRFLEQTIAHIAEDLKELLPNEAEFVANPDYSDMLNRYNSAHSDGYNQAIEVMVAAIEQYTTRGETK